VNSNVALLEQPADVSLHGNFASSNLTDCDKAYHTALLVSNAALRMIVHGHGGEGCGFPSPSNIPRRADSFGCPLSRSSARTLSSRRLRS